MALKQIYSFSGIQAYTNPMLQKDGDLLYAVNVTSTPLGGLRKRSGYTTLLGTPDNATVLSLFQYTSEDESINYLYRKSGTILYTSLAGTGAWTTAVNGTVGANAHIGHAVYNDTLFIGDGVGTIKHSTNGTTFADGTLAPIGEFLEEYQQRLYVGGTNSTLFFSTTGNGTDWSTAGTSDSSSIEIPGESRINGVYKLSDRIIPVKRRGQMFRWDGDILVDNATRYGPSSPYSFAKTEDYGFFLNRKGIFGTNGAKPQLLSNPIQDWIYNDDNTGITGSLFTTAPGETFKYDYFASVGTINDTFIKDAIPKALIKYNYQRNDFFFYATNDYVTSLAQYVDTNGDEQFIFGSNNGQVYQFSGTATSDNGVAIESIVEFFTHFQAPLQEKKLYELRASFNPGSQAKIQVGLSYTFNRDQIKWLPLCDTNAGDIKVRFPQGSRCKFLFVRIIEASTAPPWEFYGCEIEYDLIPDRSN